MLVFALPRLSSYLCRLCPMCQSVQAGGGIHPTKIGTPDSPGGSWRNQKIRLRQEASQVD